MMTDYSFSSAKFERLSNDGKGFLSLAGPGKSPLENILLVCVMEKYVCYSEVSSIISL